MENPYLDGYEEYEPKTPACSVSERIKARIDASTQKGIEKYGATLDRQDLSLRDWLEHALEETLDKAKYLQKAIDELDRIGRSEWGVYS